MKKVLIALIACAHIHVSRSTILVPGNAAAVLGSSNPNANTLSFPQAIAATAFDHYTGQLYVALSKNSSSPTPVTIGNSAAFALSLCQRATQPAFVGIAPSTLQSTGFDFLALSTSQGNFYPILGVIPSNSPNTLTQKTMYILSNGLKPGQSPIIQQSATILGTNPVVGAPGVATQGIAGLEANAEYYFVATFTNSDGFGSDGSGIAVVAYDPTTLIPEQINAVPGDPGIKSVLVDSTISQVKIANDPLITENRVALHWNSYLERLYIGLQLETAGAAGDGAKSIVVGQQQSNENGELTLYSFLPDAALINGQVDKIVGVKQSGSAVSLSAGAIKSMRTSTGASYLIVWGGNGTISTDPAVGGGTTGNTIYALPLVDVGDPDNATQGVLANKTSFNSTTKKFTTPATANGELTTITDSFAQVGAGPLPVQPATPISGIGGENVNSNGNFIPGNTIDIQVIGDTVYVAIGSEATDDDDAGIFSSQAMFDNQGKIAAWTPWTKRSFPFNGFTNNPEYPDTTRFVVADPVTAQIYAVDNFLAQTVRQTHWDNGQFMDPLPTAVSAALPNGCYSVLDLNQDTRGFNPATTYRYALFGGINAVAFAFTSQARTTPSSLQSSQKIITNFQNGTAFNGKNFIVTSLPQNAGTIKVLEYSRQLTGSDTNYFFAGGNNGLNVFADQFGNGFSTNTLATLNIPPFSTGIWQKAPEINGPVIDIKTSGQTLYVLTLTQNGQTPAYTLLSIPYTANIASMFTAGNISTIAQSGVAASGSDLSGTAVFYGIQIISTDTTKEQLALATNNGLFVSAAPGGVQAATSQAAAMWTKQNPNSTSILFSSIAGIDTQKPTTIWPISTQDPTRKGIYNRSSLNQLSGGSSTLFDYSPIPFDPNSANPAFASYPLMRYFWSDGGQSMAIVNSPINQCPASRVLAIPNNLAEWNLSTAALLTAPSLLATPQLYWLKRIGATGLLLAGTNRGVISLE